MRHLRRPNSKVACFLTFTLLSNLNTFVYGQNAVRGVFAPQDGDTIVFLGDSITHQCLFTQYIENYFLTRFPHRNISFHNAGVAGDTAADAIKRFTDDVASHQPTYVFLLFGMNDGKYKSADIDNYTNYRNNMSALLDEIKGIEAIPIVLSPTMFDHAVADRRSKDDSYRFKAKEFAIDYNAVMALYGAWNMGECRRREISFVDLWNPLNTITRQQRETTPDFTLIGDAIHPQASGQVLMAVEILKQLNAGSTSVGRIRIGRTAGQWTKSSTVSDLKFEESTQTLKFWNRSNSLPWVIPDQHATLPLRWQLPSDGPNGYRLANAAAHFNESTLQIRGLPPGQYQLTVDKVAVGRHSSDQMGLGISIQHIEAMPQYKQAMNVAILNRQRTDDHVRPMRDKWSNMKRLSRMVKVTPEIDQKLDATRTAITDDQLKADSILQQARAASKPKLHLWSIKRLSSER